MCTFGGPTLALLKEREAVNRVRCYFHKDRSGYIREGS